MSPSSLITRAILLVVPALVAALGGFLAFRLRQSTIKSRTAQLATASTLLGSSVASYVCDLPALFWVVQLLLALPCCVQFTVGLRFVAKLASSLTVPRRWDFGLLALSPMLLIWALWQLNSLAEPNVFELKPEPPLLTREASETAYTDRGKQIHLFELRPESADTFPLSGDIGLAMSDTPTPYRSIRVTDPSGASNCAGWVFTGAHHLVQCADVDSILEDNGYQPVKKPRVGDVIIYRDDGNEVTHAGSVAFLLNGEQPFIESKWGYQGVFIHLPEGSPFGLHWTFYRSSRPNGHLLRMIPLAAEPGTPVQGVTSP
jgi:hypothetical protein